MPLPSDFLAKCPTTTSHENKDICQPYIIDLTKTTAENESLPDNYQPCRYDVIFGRGDYYLQNFGNIRFREIVSEYLEDYSKAKTQLDRTSLYRHIIERVENDGFVKFVKFSNREQKWILVDHIEACSKVEKMLHEQCCGATAQTATGTTNAASTANTFHSTHTNSSLVKQPIPPLPPMHIIYLPGGTAMPPTSPALPPEVQFVFLPAANEIATTYPIYPETKRVRKNIADIEHSIQRPRKTSIAAVLPGSGNSVFLPAANEIATTYPFYLETKRKRKRRTILDIEHSIQKSKKKLKAAALPGIANTVKTAKTLVSSCPSSPLQTNDDLLPTTLCNTVDSNGKNMPLTLLEQ